MRNIAIALIEDNEPPNPFPAPSKLTERSVDILQVCRCRRGRFTKLPQAPAILSSNVESLLVKMTCDRVVLASFDRTTNHPVPLLESFLREKLKELRVMLFNELQGMVSPRPVA
jgi:hypothetical protein